MFSEWAPTRCAKCAVEDSRSDPKLESALPSREDARTRAQARKVAVLSKTTWKFGELAGDLKDDLFSFLVNCGGDLTPSKVPKHLAHLFVDGWIDTTKETEA